MTDKRNEYRAVRREGCDYWRLSFRCWWWPFWESFGGAATEESAYRKCLEHSMQKRSVLSFGRLPPLDSQP